MTICERVVDRHHPLFVIAELGLNHGGDCQRALRLVDAAADAGASAIKIQSFRADRLVAQTCPAPAHVRARSLQAFFRRFELDRAAHERIAERVHERGLALVATPFDEEIIPLLEAVGCDAYKIASGDLTYPGLIERVARMGKPMLLSTGMSELDEVRVAVDHARRAGAVELALLHCVSAYPVPSGQENLAAIATLDRSFGVTVGLSDHSTEALSAPLAVALGASIYERHFTLEGEPDQVEHEVSSTASELRAIIAMAERARIARGDGRKTCGGAERGNLSASRRGLHAARDLRAGELLDVAAAVALRPAQGVDPRRAGDITGRRLANDVADGQPLRMTDLTGSMQEVVRDVA